MAYDEVWGEVQVPLTYYEFMDGVLGLILGRDLRDSSLHSIPYSSKSLGYD